MTKEKNVLALIPARGGSKRLPRKNVMNLAGKPLISWSIEAAKKSKYISDIVVSTDDDEIARVSELYEAMVPFRRPKSLSGDKATTDDVLLHALETLDADYDIVIVLQPTSPLRNEHHIDEVFELMLKKSAEGIVTVTQCEHSPLWANTLPKDGNMGGFIEADAKTRSQDLESYYRLNGAIYMYNVNSIKSNKGLFYNDQVFSYVMSNKYSVDIDTKLDFDFAETIIKLS